MKFERLSHFWPILRNVSSVGGFVESSHVTTHRLGGQCFAYSGIVQPPVRKPKPRSAPLSHQSFPTHIAQPADTSRSHHAPGLCRIRAGDLPTHSRAARLGRPSSRPAPAWHARDSAESFCPLVSSLSLLP